MPDPSLQDLGDKLDDLARLLVRQGATLGGLADAASGSGPDLTLLVDLHALRVDALACAVTARSRRERAAFTAIAARLELMLAGRGGVVVEPVAGVPFDTGTMEAAEVVATDDPALGRTVAALLEPGLQVGGRSVRPARVAVYRVG